MEPIVVGDITIYPSKRRVEVGGKHVNVVGRQWDFLFSLASQAGKLMTREILLASIYPDPETRPKIRAIDMLASRVRSLVGHNVIVGVYGYGYTLITE